jgi:hypothetical protein
METNINEIHRQGLGIWKIEKKRTAFKLYLSIYIIVNAFLWTIWYINIENNINAAKTQGFPWPLWPTLFCGIGVLFNYFEIYKSKNYSSEKEYQNLKNNQ